MAEIIRPFPEINTNPQLDGRLVPFQMEIQRLEAHRAETLRKYEDALRALGKQKQVSAHLIKRLERTELQLNQEQGRMKKTQEMIASYTKQWAQMVENDRKLRNAYTELQKSAKALDEERLKLKEEKIAAAAELKRVQLELSGTTRNYEELTRRHRQIQENLLNVEREQEEQTHRAALLEQELQHTRAALAQSEQNLTRHKEEAADYRFRAEQLRRDLDVAKLCNHELERLHQEALEREQKCLSQIEELKNLQSNTNALLEAERAAHADTRGRLLNTEKSYEQLMKDRTDLVRRGDEAYAEAARITREFETFQTNAATLQSQLTSAHEAANEQIKTLEGQVASREQKLLALNADITHLSEELNETIQSLQLETSAHHTTRENLEKTEALYQQLMSDRSSLVKRGDDAYREIANTKELLENARTERESALLACSKLQNEISEIRERFRNAEQQRINHAGEQESLQADLERTQEELSAANAELQSRDEREQKLRDELQHSQSLVEQLAEDRALLNDQNQNTEAELRQTQCVLESVREELRIQKSELYGIKAALEQALAHTQKLETERDHLREEMADTRKKSERTRQEFSTLNQKLKQSEQLASQKIKTEEDSKAALWEELSRAEKRAEEARDEATRHRAELEMIRKMQKPAERATPELVNNNTQISPV